MRINVIGSGFMGTQIASLLSIIGFDVLLWHQNDNNLKNQIDKAVRKNQKILKVKSLGSIKLVNDLQKLDNEITIETVIEDLEIKKKIFQALSYNENIFSNTSSIKLSNMGQNINGFHFMNPVTFKLIEICKIGAYSEKKLNFLITELEKISYKIFEVKDTPGYIVNKILFKDISFFFYMIEKEKIDKKNLINIYNDHLKFFNPIKLINLIGVDTSLKILRNLNAYDKNYYIPNLLIESEKKNILGNKNNTEFKIL
jgi:3-hydroxybutyryl-CoA dehydrogenase